MQEAKKARVEGYPTELFVSQPVEELLLCAVCTCVARDAVEAPCGHCFCSACANDWMSRAGGKQTAACPSCREPLEPNDVRPVASLRRRINGLDVRCGNDGCDAKMTLGRLEQHMEKECGRRRVACSVCNAAVVHCELAEHTAGQLPAHVQAVAESNLALRREVATLRSEVGALREENAALRAAVAPLIERAAAEEKERKLREEEEKKVPSPLLTAAEYKQLRDWINRQGPWKLLYRSSRDGADAATFHRLCDGKAPVVVLVRSDKGYIVGGYTAMAFTSDGSYKQGSAETTWLFGVNTHGGGRKMDQIPLFQNGQSAVYCHPSYGPTFGSNHDLYIANGGAGSYSNLNGAYRAPNGQAYYMFGQQQFSATEVEVFVV